MSAPPLTIVKGKPGSDKLYLRHPRSRCVYQLEVEVNNYNSSVYDRFEDYTDEEIRTESRI